jgi:hypothetical protein
MWAKGLNAKMLITECFLFTVGRDCRVKRFTTGWQMFRWWRKVWKEGAKVAQTTVERILCSGFRRTGNAMGQVYQCWWRICREINVFPRFEYHMFYVLYLFVTYILTLPRRRHVHAVRLSDKAACRNCEQEEESCQFPVLAGHRMKIFDCAWLVPMDIWRATTKQVQVVTQRTGLY